MVLAILAGLISVLDARNPGGGAWAILMVLLVVVFLIPWLEGSRPAAAGARPGQLQLDSPWTLVLRAPGRWPASPTTCRPATARPRRAWVPGLVLEYLGLTRTDWTPPARAMAWTGVAWSSARGVWLAAWCAGRPEAGRNRLERLWFGFRDHWGVVWALRTQERFNRTAELARWPVRLTWFGLAPADRRRPGRPGGPPTRRRPRCGAWSAGSRPPERLEAPGGGDQGAGLSSRAAGRMMEMSNSSPDFQFVHREQPLGASGKVRGRLAGHPGGPRRRSPRSTCSRRS